MPPSSASRASVSYAMAMSPSGILSSGAAPCSGGAGNDKTFVGCSFPRQRPLRLAIVASSHSNTDSSALRWPKSTFEVAAIARRTMSSASGTIPQVSDSTRMSTTRARSLFSAGGLLISFLSARADGARSLVIRSHDLCHQFVSYDVLAGKRDAADALHIGEQTNRLCKPRGLAAWQIDLARIAGDHHAAVLA